MPKVYAVYQYGWRDPDHPSIPLGDGVTAPALALIGLCRERGRAERAAGKVRRSTRAAVALGLRSREALVGVRAYDPRDFVLPQDRETLSRREAHAVATTGMMARREQLGVG